MMDRREALLLVERIKRRTRDPDVLTLCEYGLREGGGLAAFSRGRVATLNLSGMRTPKKEADSGTREQWLEKYNKCDKAVPDKPDRPLH